MPSKMHHQKLQIFKTINKKKKYSPNIPNVNPKDRKLIRKKEYYLIIRPKKDNHET